MVAPVFKSLEEAHKARLAIKVAETSTYSLKDAGRPLTLEEEYAETGAVKFPVSKFPRVKPVPGTLGFLFRNLNGGNGTVAEALRNASESNASRFVKNFIILWEAMDEHSQNRVDIWDILCRKFSVQYKKFWGVIQEGLFDFNEAMTQIALSDYKPQHVELLKRMAAKERNHTDRRILTEVLGLTKQVPLFSFEDNSKNITVNAQVPSFNGSLERSGISKLVPPIKKPKALSAGEQGYIDAEFLSEGAKEPLEFKPLKIELTPEENS